LNYMLSKTPGQKPTRWAATECLMILPRAGQDLNAYYDRSGLKFFYFGDPISRKIVFACEASDVVSHEFGHAYLDILRPDFWSAQCSEIWAFHESFGDMTAILTILQSDQVINKVLQETAGNLESSNTVSKLAEEMGVGLYHLTHGVDGELTSALRD